MMRLMGTTSAPSAGFSTFSPSTEDSTEIAGVSMPSPKNKASPTTAADEMVVFNQRGSPGERCASEASAMTPPSPLLSARRMKMTYLIVTTMMSDHRISEM